MQRYVLKVCLVVVLVISGLSIMSGAGAASPLRQDSPVYIYFFWGEGCPHCATAKLFLEDLTRRYPRVEVVAFEVYNSEDNQTLFRELAAAHGFEPRYVPTIFVGDQHWEGFADPLRAEIETAVRACVEGACPDAGAGIIPGHEMAPTAPLTPEIGSVEAGETDEPEGVPDARPEDGPGTEIQDAPEDTGAGQPPSEVSLTIPVLGAVNLGGQSLWASTALISFVDGFNPCSLWVLSILITLTLRTGSRRRIFTIGLIYITVTAGVYVLFIAGLFTVLTVVSFLGWIQAAVSVLALFFAVVNIKDYFWYKEGLSFTIADEKKPGIYKRMRKVMNAGDSFWALAGATFALGAGVSLVEFSCTAGFPVIWTNLVAAQDVAPLTFALLLLLYMVIYQIDELVIFGVAVVTLKASRMEEKHGRILKLIGGTMMLSLAAVMLISPALMNELGTSLLIFGGAVAVAFLVLIVHRRLLPRLGIYIGTELTPPTE